MMTDSGARDLFSAFYYSNTARWINPWMGRQVHTQMEPEGQSWVARQISEHR